LVIKGFSQAEDTVVMKNLNAKLVLGSLGLLFICGLIAANPQADTNLTLRREEERLTFQTSGPWSPRTNLNADVAMVYGIGPRMPDNLKTWRDHGYKVAVMTGVAWGGYQDYLDGKFDGTNHWDQAQMDSAGKMVLHGGNKSIPYISPGEDYGKYLTVGIQRALDAGAEAIYLEEPEFWARSGWEENFKREWKTYYGEKWQAPDSSPDAQYRASKLKYFLYRRALAQVFNFVKAYGRAHGRNIPCYVATHSLINYANWRIVSPESSLIDVGTDGYIAQVWTGTARTPNYYDGQRKERTFETAFLEYGAMQNLVRASGRRVWYLNDPIEDDPNHDWNDYRSNWESTLTASLLQPEVWRYEVMPWPDRVFNSKHPVKPAPVNKSVRELEQAPTGTGLGGFGPAPKGEMVGIPKAYETELQSVISALGDMKQEDVRWEIAGTRNVGVLVSDTMMFERADPNPSDASLGSFYGLAMPLIKRGVPVEPLQIESATAPGFLNRYKLLLLTYEGQKPPKPEFHQALAKWVRDGGALVVVDDDSDPYNTVREWWNTAPYAYTTPRQHLFSVLGIPQDATGLHRVGRGVVLSERISPASLTYRADGGEVLRKFARQAAAAIHLQWKETNALVLRRGPYVVAAGLDESLPNARPYVLHGKFVNLFDANLPVLTNVTVSPGSRALLFDLSGTHSSKVPRAIAAACKIRNEHASIHELSFMADGIADTNAVVRIQMQQKPKSISIAGKTPGTKDYAIHEDTLLLRFPNSVEPIPVEIKF
jgi:hypothetical protein